MVSLAAASFCIAAAEAPVVQTNCYQKNGKPYIEKIYTVKNGQEIDHLFSGDFELNGYTYHQVDVKSEPVVEVLKKEVTQTETTVVHAENMAEVVANLGEKIPYKDDEGYIGDLKLDTSAISYTATGYTTKSYTKSASKMYYGLPSMDTSGIPKSIWSDGIGMTLYDIQWIGGNHADSGDTTVGNQYQAKALYSGIYSVKIPTAYCATAVYTGEVEKEVSEEMTYTLTYLGEEAELQVIEESPSHFPIFLGIGSVLLLIAGGGWLYSRRKRDIPDAASDLDGLIEEAELSDEEKEEKDEYDR